MTGKDPEIRLIINPEGVKEVLLSNDAEVCLQCMEMYKAIFHDVIAFDEIIRPKLQNF